MSKNFLSFSVVKSSLLTASLCISLLSSCAVSAKNASETSEVKNDAVVTTEKPNNLTKNSYTKAKLTIVEGSPADTVRIFYKNLREKHFREALMMTNLRPAVEGLSDAEMQDLTPDFEPLAKEVPEKLEFNGDTIVGETATVWVMMPDEDSGQLERKQIDLRRENNNWIILTADAKAEAEIKRAGKNYFFELRFDVHHAEAKNMMERISKAESVFAIQNGGSFGDIQTLVTQGLLPADIQSTESTGYKFSLSLTAENKKYFATAEPAVYGKTGKQSFLLESDGADKQARLKFDDNKGKPLKN